VFDPQVPKAVAEAVRHAVRPVGPPLMGDRGME
jgi:hypothetical protein